MMLAIMASAAERRQKIIDFVDSWDPKFSLIALLGLIVAAYLGHVGSEKGKIAERTAEVIHWVCLGFGVIVALLQIWNWLPKWSRPDVYEDPWTGFPYRDERLPGLVFKSGFQKYRFFVPDRTYIEWFVKWSEGDPVVQVATNLATYKRRRLYENWYRAKPAHFLVMLSKQTVETDWSIVALSIILDLPRRTLDRLKAHHLAVIDIQYEDLVPQAGERSGRYLLYDTLIFARAFQERFSDFKRWHSLLHLSQFPTPKEKAKVSIFIEPDNARLRYSLQRNRYGPHSIYKLVNDHDLFEFVLPGADIQSKRARRFVDLWEELKQRKIEIPVGCDEAVSQVSSTQNEQ
jgi:hypothetical protein